MSSLSSCSVARLLHLVQCMKWTDKEDAKMHSGYIKSDAIIKIWTEYVSNHVDKNFS
uniref:Uncharacterized protein n=1 Tax=Aegilops tauschii TaxID=37682 RepID=N1QVB6_AEGTA